MCRDWAPNQTKQKRSEDTIKSARKSDTLTLVMPYSGTGNVVSRIINKHF